jgi:NAD(P)H dehydrogenase (quinone)
MTRLIISGASGDLGRRVTDLLLQANAGVELTLVTRHPAKLPKREAPGLRICQGDYRDPASLDAAYQGGDVLFLISGLDLGKRVQEHRNAIAAAKKAGVRHIVYTSVGGTQKNNPALSAQDHYLTELDLRASGLQYTFLRNGLYAEILATVVFQPAIAAGRLELMMTHGYMAPVSKRDVASCAAACLLDHDRHAGAVYEITGHEMLNFVDMARIASEVTGRPIEVVNVTYEQRLAFFDSLGYPREYDPDMQPSADGHMWASDELLSAEIAVVEGYQAVMSHHVRQILGTDPEPFRSVMERCQSLRYDEIDAVPA